MAYSRFQRPKMPTKPFIPLIRSTGTVILSYCINLVLDGGLRLMKLGFGGINW